jgi:hypothetical protein
MPADVTWRRLAPVLAVLAAVLPYLPTLDDFFVQDDFGVVGLLASKPAAFFPRWFVVPWMENIWEYTPDEIRPFVAVTYQAAAQWEPGSPLPQHLLNVALHAGNAWLVLGIASRVAGLSAPAALAAAMAFALLPMQTESVAWVTGRVDSMPAFFYLAALLLYARWRDEGSRAAYWGAVAACFVALFSKQNTVTLGPALVAYDVLVRREPIRVTWGWLRPYVPFAALTAGYLLLRYAVFGEMARESMLHSARLAVFGHEVTIHLRRMMFGEPGLAIEPARAALIATGAALVVAALGWLRAPAAGRRVVRPLVYFGGIWLVLGIAPTIVAGYASPRHMYLASAGWAIVLGIAVEVLAAMRPARVARAIAAVAAAGVLAAYAVILARDVRLWGVRADVSRAAVADVSRDAAAAPPGTLIIAGAPRRSWDFALPYALRPPFVAADVTARARVVSDSSLHCCPAVPWEAYTRRSLRAWADDPRRPPVIAMYWDQETGRLSRVSDADEPFLRAAVHQFLATDNVAALDRAIRDTLRQLAVPRVVGGLGPASRPRF